MSQKLNQPVFLQKYFFIVLSFFSSTWLISNIFAIKVVYFFGITLTGGFITFPLTTSLNTLILEVYGYKNARQAMWSGTLLNLLYLFFINIINMLPSSPSWQLQNAFQSILIPNTRIILASLASFWLSGFLNNYLLAKFKYRGNTLLLRILISTFISLTLDLSLYFVLAFLGTYSFHILINIFFWAYLKKIFFEILVLPVIWLSIDFFKKIEGFEVYDLDTNFTPFSLDNVFYLKNYNKMSNDKIIPQNI